MSLLVGCSVLPGDARAEDGPITVMTWAPQNTGGTDMPGMPAMAQAYARWVNATGGINGRKLRVLTCNDRNDSVRAAQCADRARSEGAVAVVGSYSQHGRTFMSVLEAAGIPYIGGYGVADEEFTSPLSYPVNGGHVTLMAGNGRQLAAECERVSLVRPDTIAGDQLPDPLNAGLAAGGRSPAADIRAPENVSSYTREARRALAAAGVGPGSCVTAVLGGRTDTFFDSFRRLEEGGPEVRTASLHGSVTQTLVNQTGGVNSQLEGAYITSWYPASSDPRWEPMTKVITEHAFGDNRISLDSPGVQTTWIAYTVLRAALEHLGEEPITPRAVQHALETMPPVDTGGLTPKLSWGYDDMLALRNHPRLVNSMVTFQQVRGGRLTQVREEFIDMQKTLEASPNS